MMGGGGKSSKGGAEEPQASRVQSQIAQQLYGQTQPIRDYLIGDTISFLGGDPTQTASPGGNLPPNLQQKAGGSSIPQVAQNITGANVTGGTDVQNRQPFQYNAAGTPEFQFIQDVANRRFNQARESSLANLPAGGALDQALSDIGIQRAQTLTGAEADLFNQQLNRAYSLATGQPFTGGGLGSAGAIQAQIAQANASQNAAAKGGIGQGVGLGLGYQLGGKNTAAAAAGA